MSITGWKLNTGVYLLHEMRGKFIYNIFTRKAVSSYSAVSAKRLFCSMYTQYVTQCNVKGQFKDNGKYVPVMYHLSQSQVNVGHRF